MENSGTYRRIVQVDLKFLPKPVGLCICKGSDYQMLVKESARRPLLHRLLEHPWIVQNADPSGIYRG